MNVKSSLGEMTVLQFLNEIKSIESGIQRINDVEKKLSGYAHQANFSLDNIPSDDVEQITASTSDLIKSLKERIDQLKEYIQSHKDSLNQSDMKMEQNALDTTVRKLATAVQNYNATQVEYDTNVKARVKGVLKTVLDKTDAEIDEVIESGQSIEAIRGAMMGNVNATIKTNVRQVEETYMSVLNIQRSMVQLNQMFMDLAFLVNEQGESIDKIEMNISKAASRVNDANKALEESIQEAKKNRKRKCCVLIIVIVCAIVLVCVLVPFLCLVYYKQKKSTCAVGPDSTRRAPLHQSQTLSTTPSSARALGAGGEQCTAQQPQGEAEDSTFVCYTNRNPG